MNPIIKLSDNAASRIKEIMANAEKNTDIISLLGGGKKLTKRLRAIASEDINEKTVGENHPSRIKNNNMVICKICNSPAPEGEISRWGKCTFCWRKNN